MKTSVSDFASVEKRGRPCGVACNRAQGDVRNKATSWMKGTALRSNDESATLTNPAPPSSAPSIPYPPPQACQHQRALSMLADMHAMGLKPDQESFAAAAEACIADASGHGGNTAMRLLRLARAQGLKPDARAVAASLAACVGGRTWRMAVPTIEKMLQASGTRAWEDVFEFLDGATRDKLGRTVVVEEDGTRPEGSL